MKTKADAVTVRQLLGLKSISTENVGETCCPNWL